jgi:putative endonuclease
MGFIYIIKSRSNGQYYIGSTPDYNCRLLDHNQGKCKATKNRGPWLSVFVQEFSSMKKARQVEYQLKKKKPRDIIDQIVKDQKIKFMRR